MCSGLGAKKLLVEASAVDEPRGVAAHPSKCPSGVAYLRGARDKLTEVHLVGEGGHVQGFTIGREDLGGLVTGVEWFGRWPRWFGRWIM